MKLASLNAAISARLSLGGSIVLFLTEAYPTEEDAANLKLNDALGRNDSLGPACNHTPAAKLHELLLSHVPLQREGRHLTRSASAAGPVPAVQKSMFRFSH